MFKKESENFEKESENFEKDSDFFFIIPGLFFLLRAFALHLGVGYLLSHPSETLDIGKISKS